MPSFADLELHTPRLHLRPFRSSDTEALFRIFSSAQTSRYLSRPAWTSLQQAEERIAKDLAGTAKGEHLRLALETRESHVVVGECCLFHFIEESRRAEVGYALSADHLNQGYMNEALRALMEHAFSAIGLNRVEADIDPRNEGSARTLERLGFTKEGHLRERWIVGGEVSDTDLYGLLARDWAAANPRVSAG
jgi:[ribosomal protein S5]-alanine N-acetyltransferase